MTVPKLAGLKLSSICGVRIGLLFGYNFCDETILGLKTKNVEAKIHDMYDLRHLKCNVSPKMFTASKSGFDSFTIERIGNPFLNFRSIPLVAVRGPSPSISLWEKI